MYDGQVESWYTFILASSFGGHVIRHVVDYVACRSVSADHKCQTSVRGFRSAHSQLLATFPDDLGKMPSPSLPSTSTEIVIFDFLIPDSKQQYIALIANSCMIVTAL